MKRFDFDVNRGEMCESASGAFVKYDDAVLLATALERLLLGFRSMNALADAATEAAEAIAATQMPGRVFLDAPIFLAALERLAAAVYGDYDEERAALRNAHNVIAKTKSAP